MLWHPARVRDMLEPLSILGVCAWLAYGSWEMAVAHQTEAIILGSILGLSFLGSAASLVLGNLFGGWWRSYPEGLSWSFVQKLEMVPPLLNAAVLSHYSRIIGRAATTPVWGSLYMVAVCTSLAASHCDPHHCFAVRELILIHHCAVFAYAVMIQSSPNNPTVPAPPSQYFEQIFVAILQFGFSFYVGYSASSVQSEATRLRDMQVHALATLQRDVTLALVTNYLPPSVLFTVQERSAAGDASEMIAWKFDSGCVLQSDIVGFTALGSRISPEQLCR